jgi:hypothetical protein
MAMTLRVKVSVFIINWFDRVNKRRGITRKEWKNGGNDFRKMKDNNRKLRVSFSLSLSLSLGKYYFDAAIP